MYAHVLSVGTAFLWHRLPASVFQGVIAPEITPPAGRFGGLFHDILGDSEMLNMDSQTANTDSELTKMVSEMEKMDSEMLNPMSVA